jgi:hypothetical protein
MPTGSIIWDIKNKRLVSGPYPSVSDGNQALRKHGAQSGARMNDKVNSAPPAQYEVVAVTLP